MTDKDLVGYWLSKDIEFALKPIGRANILLHDCNKKAIGLWKFDSNRILIQYNFKGFEHFASEFKSNNEKYAHKQIFSIITYEKTKIEVLDDLSNQLILTNSPEKTNELFKKEEQKEDLLEAYLMTFLIMALVGPILRWLLNPDIPTWIIVAVTFFIGLFYIRRNKY